MDAANYHGPTADDFDAQAEREEADVQLFRGLGISSAVIEATLACAQANREAAAALRGEL